MSDFQKMPHFQKMNNFQKNAKFSTTKNALFSLGLTLSGPERPKGAKDEVKRPKGPPARSRGPEGP